MSRVSFRPRSGAILVCLLALAGCGRPGDDQAGSGDGGGPSGEVIVFAAASLRDAFEELATAFETEYPRVDVVFNFAGSQTLASQINQDAPADVLASANEIQMDEVSEAGNLAEGPQVFATNWLAIAVEAGNPFGLTGLADLADPELVLVLPAEEVPAGSYARKALDAAGVSVTPSSLERDVRAALSKVELGEADASVVYASDVGTASDAVEGVSIPVDENVPAAYPIAPLADAPNPGSANAFVTFVLSEQGQRILSSHGFASP